MHYLVDGYNLLFRVLQQKAPLEQTRRVLIEELNATISSLNFHVTLVFDGAKGSPPPTLKTHFKAIALIYTTEGQSADDHILEEISLSRHPAEITVVTNDRELREKSRRLGTETLTIDAFLSRLMQRLSKKKSNRPLPAFRESERELKRLLAIFEKRMAHQDEEEKNV